MIQVYSPSNKNFTWNGDAVLVPMSCLLTSVLNGAWTLELIHPYDTDERWKYIEREAVIKAPTFHDEEQLFRIYDVTRSNSDIKATAYPVFLDAAKEVMLIDTRPTNKNGQDALNIMAGTSKYSFLSDIESIHTAYYVRKNLIEALSGDFDNAFLNLWGGEIFYNNYKAIVNKKIGSETNVIVRYGRNLQSLEEKVDTEPVVTRIIPKAYNGYMLEGDEPWVDSPLIDTYPRIHTKVIEFSDIKLKSDMTEDESGKGYETLAELRQALVERCEEKYARGMDKPSLNIKINMTALENTIEYKEYKNMETLSLGDTVYCIHDRLAISTKNRVISLKYDCIRKRIESIELGDFESKYFDNLTVNSATTVAKVNELTNEMSNGEIVFNHYTNTQKYDISGTEDTKIIALVYQTKKNSSGTFNAEILLESSADQYTEVEFEYQIDSNIIDYKPTETFINGKHIISLMFPLENIKPNILHNFDVYMKVTKGKATIGKNQIKAFIYGQGMASLAYEWDGTLTIDEKMHRIPITPKGALAVKPISGETSFTMQVPTKKGIEDVMGRIQFITSEDLQLRALDYNMLLNRVSVSKTFADSDMEPNEYITDDWTIRTSYELDGVGKETDSGHRYDIEIDKSKYSIEEIEVVVDEIPAEEQ